MRKGSFLELEALPPDLRDLPPSAIPGCWLQPPGRVYPRPDPGLAPESALRLHPCRALSSAPVSTSVGSPRRFAKRVGVASREI
jgi:hypothetical protein